MISFAVDPRFIQDLEDDFMVNEGLTLYEFIGKDPIKAFYLGLYIGEWFQSIDRKQRYLYSKQARHNKDDLQKYSEQIGYWGSKYPKDTEGGTNMAELAEFIYNNMFWDEKTEESDKIKLAFFFGDMIATHEAKERAQKETQETPQAKDFQEEVV